MITVDAHAVAIVQPHIVTQWRVYCGVPLHENIDRNAITISNFVAGISC